MPVWYFVGGGSLAEQAFDGEMTACSCTLLYVYNVNGAPEIRCSFAAHNLYANIWWLCFRAGVRQKTEGLAKVLGKAGVLGNKADLGMWQKQA